MQNIAFVSVYQATFSPGRLRARSVVSLKRQVFENIIGKFRKTNLVNYITYSGNGRLVQDYAPYR